MLLVLLHICTFITKKCCYQCPVTHLYLHIPFSGLLHVCSYTNIRAVDTMYQCVLTLWLHTMYTSSYYVSTQVLRTQYKVGPTGKERKKKEMRNLSQEMK